MGDRDRDRFRRRWCRDFGRGGRRRRLFLDPTSVLSRGGGLGWWLLGRWGRWSGRLSSLTILGARRGRRGCVRPFSSISNDYLGYERKRIGAYGSDAVGADY